MMPALIPITYLSEERFAQSARAILFKLQLEQFSHDEKYHREIARLDIKQRLTHLTLHFAKYLGYLGVLSTDRLSPQSIERVLVDTFIIALSFANTLNVRIADHLVSDAEDNATLTVACETLSKSAALEVPLNPNNLLIKLSVPTGKLAKACEGLDHIENLSYRDELISGAIEILKIVLGATALSGVDIAKATRARLAFVKERSIFHGV